MSSVAKNISFIFMPFGHLRFPSLGISLLKAILMEKGISSNIHYFNIDWVRGYMTGPMDRRLEVFDVMGTNSGAYMAAEACFAPLLFPEQTERHHGLIRNVGDRDVRTQIEYGINNAQRFIDYCLGCFPWQEVEIAGFSSSFNQNLASLALAKQLKVHFPKLAIVFGGANMETVMGEQISRSFPFVDYAFSGDADLSFPQFAKSLLSGSVKTDLPGLIFRQPDGTIHRNPESVLRDLDDLPFPDYDDFFRQYGGAKIGGAADSSRFCQIPFESSRGCWWGQKHHCSFCGLNGTSIQFRSKSAKRLIDEIIYLKDKYNPQKLCAMDNIIDHRYLKTVLPKIGDLKLDIEFSYEIKSNLTSSDIKTLAASGVRELEVGIESLSTPILKKMKKGVTALRNIQTLRLARQHDLAVTWRQLSGFPCEKWKDYSHLPKLIPKLFHLQAPCRDTVIEIEIHRYSPLFMAAMKEVPRTLHPNSGYHELYGLSDEALENLAYKFTAVPDADQVTVSSNLKQFVNPLLKFWQARDSANADLAIFYSDSGALVIDTRTALTKIICLTIEYALLMVYCDTIRSLSSIESNAFQKGDDREGRWIRKTLWDRTYDQLDQSGFPIKHVSDQMNMSSDRQRLEQLIELGLIVREGQGVLSLAIEREDDILKSCIATISQ